MALVSGFQKAIFDKKFIATPAGLAGEHVFLPFAIRGVASRGQPLVGVLSKSLLLREE